MSRKKGHAKKRRKKAIAKHKNKPSVLLNNIAVAFNNLEKSGVRIHHPKVAVFTSRGVIHPLQKEGGWVVRLFKGNEKIPDMDDE